MEIVFVSNDNTVELDELRDQDGSYDNAATVTFTLVDADGTDVTGATSVSMSYVSGSNGRYRGTLADTVSLTANRRYVAQVTATGTNSERGYWELPCRAHTRRGGTT